MRNAHFRFPSVPQKRRLLKLSNMFWDQLRLILARAVRRGLKRAVRSAQNIFMPKNINCITIIITLEGIEKIKTEKKKNEDNKTV